MKHSERYVKFLEDEVERLEKKVSELEFIVCDYEEAQKSQVILHNTHIRQDDASLNRCIHYFNDNPAKCHCPHCQDIFTVAKDKV